MKRDRSAPDLFALGEDTTPKRSRARARCSPGCSTRRAAGLRIQTIHGFCQTLLAAFPGRGGAGAGVPPARGARGAALAQRRWPRCWSRPSAAATCRWSATCRRSAGGWARAGRRASCAPARARPRRWRRCRWRGIEAVAAPRARSADGDIEAGDRGRLRATRRSMSARLHDVAAANPAGATDGRAGACRTSIARWLGRVAGRARGGRSRRCIDVWATKAASRARSPRGRRRRMPDYAELIARAATTRAAGCWRCAHAPLMPICSAAGLRAGAGLCRGLSARQARGRRRSISTI